MRKAKSTKRKSLKIVVCPETGMRLCRDNKWRSFANFGTYKECVKEFKYLKSACKAGERYRLKAVKAGHTLVIHLYDNDSMDASGRVVRNDV